MEEFWILILLSIFATNSLEKTESVKVKLEELPLKTFDEIFGDGWWDKGEAAEDLKMPPPTNFGQNVHHQIDRQNTQIEQIEPNLTDQNPLLTESDHSDNAKNGEELIAKDERKQKFDQIKAELKRAGFKNTYKHKIDETVAKELGLSLATIYRWKRKIAHTAQDKYSDSKQNELMKRYYEIKNQNPKISDENIAKMFKIGRRTLYIFHHNFNNFQSRLSSNFRAFLYFVCLHFGFFVDIDYIWKLSKKRCVFNSRTLTKFGLSPTWWTFKQPHACKVSTLPRSASSRASADFCQYRAPSRGAQVQQNINFGVQEQGDFVEYRVLLAFALPLPVRNGYVPQQGPNQHTAQVSQMELEAGGYAAGEALRPVCEAVKGIADFELHGRQSGGNEFLYYNGDAHCRMEVGESCGGNADQGERKFLKAMTAALNRVFSRHVRQTNINIRQGRHFRGRRGRMGQLPAFNCPSTEYGIAVV
uniref:Uncharacterized protein n=1 Tax=Globodera rostochiensis TaxID=31243 RepID=A0A914H3W6_GLORO